MSEDTHEHLDVERAADFDEGLLDAKASAAVAADIASCTTCAATLRSVTDASAALRDLPGVTMPADIAERLAVAVADEARGAQVPGGATTVTQLDSRRRSWLRPAIVGVAAATAIGLAVTYGSNLGAGNNDMPTAASAAATLEREGANSAYDLAATSTTASGNDYGKDAATKVASALAATPVVLSNGSRAEPQADSELRPATTSSASAAATASVSAPSTAAGALNPTARDRGDATTTITGGTTPYSATNDAFAALRDPATLQACAETLLAVSPPPVPVLVDYASYEGEPAVAIAFPSEKPDELLVYVVGVKCGAETDDIKKFLLVPRPTR